MCDEIAFWRSEDSANPDHEILSGLRPGMATVPGALLLCISSPYAHRGALYDAHRRHCGQDGDPVLVWQAPTAVMNPTVDAQVIVDAYDADEAAARSEYGALFRSDLESFIGIDVLRACVVPDRVELPPAAGVAYVAAADAALGSGKDSFTACVAHRTGATIVVDRLLEVRPPFGPAAAIAAVAAAVKPYGVRTIVSDRFSKDFVTEGLRPHELGHQVTEFDRSSAYISTLPWLTGQRVELPDNPRLLAQFANLVRKTAGSGKDSVDHVRGGHDDLSNSVALSIAMLAKHDPNRPHTARVIYTAGGTGTGSPAGEFVPALDMVRD